MNLKIDDHRLTGSVQAGDTKVTVSGVVIGDKFFGLAYCIDPKR